MAHLHVDNELDKILITLLNGLIKEIERDVAEQKEEANAERIMEVFGKMVILKTQRPNAPIT